MLTNVTWREGLLRALCIDVVPVQCLPDFVQIRNEKVNFEGGDDLPTNKLSGDCISQHKLVSNRLRALPRILILSLVPALLKATLSELQSLLADSGIVMVDGGLIFGFLLIFNGF